MKKLFLLLALSTAFSVMGFDIHELNRTLDSIHVYTDEYKMNLANDRADLLRSNKASQRIRTAMTLSDSYYFHDPDSSYYFMAKAWEMAAESGRDSLINILQLRVLSRMPLTGMAAEARNLFEQLEVPAYDSAFYKEYCFEGMCMYLNNLKLYPYGPEYDSISARAVELGETLLSLNNLTERERLGVEGVVYYLRGNYDQAAAASIEVLPILGNDLVSRHFHGRVVLEYYRSKVGYRQQYLEQLVSLAQSLLRDGVIDGALMAELGDALFELNYPEMAQKCYLAGFYALSVEPSRFREHSHSRQFLDERYNKLIDFEAKHKVYYYLFMSASILFGLLALIFIWLYFRKSRKQTEETVTLKTDTRLAELSFDVLNRTRDFNTLVDRKLTVGQSHELYNDIHSGRLIKEITEGFFEEFDRVFLKSEPDFIPRLNSLLLPDKQFDVYPDGKLSPELRIAALIKLGVDDSTRLSRILGLSLNTIYTYRNRLRGRAKDRNAFETALIAL